MLFYLCGPINGCSDKEAKGWREEAKGMLTKIGYSYKDPMDRDYRGRETDPAITKEIVEGDKRDIHSCDVLLVMFEKPSVGTSMEIMFAYHNYKKIILVDKSGKPLSPWLLYHCNKIVSDLLDVPSVL